MNAGDFQPRSVTLKNGHAASIRPLETGDGEALARFYATLRPADRKFYCPHPLTPEEALKKAARAGETGFQCLVLETPDREIGGYAWIRTKEEGEVGVFGICIRPDMQGQGAGKALMHWIMHCARRNGPPVVSLNVQKSNPGGIALYRKMGFEVVRGQLRASDNEPEYYMECRVGGDLT